LCTVYAYSYAYCGLVGIKLFGTFTFDFDFGWEFTRELNVPMLVA